MVERDSNALAKANRRFALALLKELASAPGNIFFSPFGVTLGLALVHTGAAGRTRREIDEVLGFACADDRVGELLSAFSAELKGRSAPTEQELQTMRWVEEAWRERPETISDDVFASMHGHVPTAEAFGFRLSIANGLWRQTGYRCGEAYLSALRNHYAVVPGEVDFENAPAAACRSINNWVSEKTEGRIPEVVQPQLISDLTRLMLCNSIFFKARWNQPFAPDMTVEQPFRLLDGRQVEVPTMWCQDHLRYRATEHCEVVELPYLRRELSLVAVIPTAGSFRDFEIGFGLNDLDQVLFNDAMRYVYVRLGFPKFRFKWNTRLRSALEKLGIIELFTDRADLSGIGSEPVLWVQDVLHATHVMIDEEGTEAAAATMPPLFAGIPPEPIEVRVDRPFLFFILDRPTKLVLFVGRVINPL